MKVGQSVMNKISLVGRLTRNPETRYTQSATPTAVTRFGLAVNRPYQKDKQQEADFFNCVSFGKKGEFIEKYGRKGRLASVVGSMRQNNWQGDDGTKHTTWEVLVEEINFLDKTNDAAVGETTAAPTPNIPPYDEEDDLPF